MKSKKKNFHVILSCPLSQIVDDGLGELGVSGFAAQIASSELYQ